MGTIEDTEASHTIMMGFDRFSLVKTTTIASEIEFRQHFRSGAQRLIAIEDSLRKATKPN